MSALREELQDALAALTAIEADLANQDQFEESILSNSAFVQSQADVRLLATRRSTLTKIRNTIAAWREKE